MSLFATTPVKLFLYPWHKQFVSKLVDKCTESIALENISVVYVYLKFPDGSLEQILVEESQKMVAMHSITEVPCVYATSLTSSFTTALQNSINRIITEELSLQTDEAGSIFDTGMDYYNDCKFLEASQKFDAVLLINRKHVNSLFNLSGLAHMFGYPTLAMGYTHMLLLETPDDMTTHAFLWTLTNTNVDVDSDSARKLTDTAIAIYNDIYEVTGNVLALHKLVTLQGVSASNIELVSNNPAYAKILYNDMAGKFENKLVHHLQYDAPWTMHQRIMKIIESRSNLKSRMDHDDGVDHKSTTVSPAVLVDLGCGSGLVGRIFNKFIKYGIRDSELPSSLASKVIESSNPDNSNPSSISDPKETLLKQLNRYGAELESKSESGISGLLIGIDISPAMVNIAASYSNCYDMTLCLDVKETLLVLNQSNYKNRIDMLIAADTFIYLGLLGVIFAYAKMVLTRSAYWGGSGIFSFTVENLDVSPMKKINAGATTGSTGPVELNGIGSMQYEPDEIISGQWALEQALQLLTSARFAHSTAYIHALVAKYGFTVTEEVDMVLRTEGTVPLGGKIYILELSELEIQNKE